MVMFTWLGRNQVSRWVALILGIVSVLVGVTLITRPFQSLAVLIFLVAIGSILTGVSDLFDPTDRNNARMATITGIGWLVLGGAMLI